uniref:Katanin p80 WD40 repeat-containing subunit B1 n=1 Tax=Photinus pyralis TaxID=7054 RepID=A0A1Y1KUQ5_PHOPY
MASLCKRSWKLQEFVAHNANVNCLALGHKSGRVMVTGGDDKKVNLWAIGKQSCFMSLSGHTTPIECVQFNHVEELVCAGSRAGALKVWDLEAAKLVRTLTGHRDSIKCVDFHPYGDFLVSGGSDSTIKLWDSRKKGCICTFPGHTTTVNSLKFSPDGQWIASGGEDSRIKIWDLRVGRVLKEFTEHMNSVTCVEFHPHEFLLASGSTDRSVHFFDLENFNVVSTERDVGSVRCLWFNPDGECLFTAVRDYLKVIGWEPNRLYDSVPVNWGRICDISTAQHQLVGASFHLTTVTVYVVDLKKVQPFGGPLDECPSPFTHNQSIRKSFSKAERPLVRTKATLDVKTIEESTSGTDPEEESSADITNLKDYNDIFKARQALNRTPPPPEELEPPDEPTLENLDPTEPQILAEIGSESLEALSLDDTVNCNHNSSLPLFNSTPYSRSKSNLDQIFASPRSDPEIVLPKINSVKQQLYQKFNLQRQSSCKDVPEKLPKNNIKHSMSEVTLNKSSVVTSRNISRKNSFSKPTRNSSVPNVSRIPTTAKQLEKSVPVKSQPVDIYVNNNNSTKVSPEGSLSDDYIPAAVDKPVGLDLDDFLPKNHHRCGFDKQLPDMSEAEVLGVVMRGHEPMMAVLVARQRNLKIVIAQHKTKDVKSAIETAISLNDLSVIVDVLSVFNNKYSSWNLDLCVLLLPKIQELMQSKFEMYMTVACNSLKLILKHFGSVIKSCIQSPVGSFGVDISREERYQKSLKCYDYLGQVRSLLLKKQAIPGTLGGNFREVHTLMQHTFD